MMFWIVLNPSFFLEAFAQDLEGSINDDVF